jgi:DNA helicase-2/ATP-dependent DNA helicase PcrA
MTTITSDSLLLDTDRHAHVTAGPGAGKTYWLVEHTKNVIRRSKKLHPYAKIGIISYTNVAADELKEKLGSSATRAATGTIHSFLYANVVKPYLYLIKQTSGQPVVKTTLMEGHDEHHVSYTKLEAWLASLNDRQVLYIPRQRDLIKQCLATICWRQNDDPEQWTLDIAAPQWLIGQLARRIKAKLTCQNLLAYKTLYWSEGIIDHDDVLYFATRILHDYPQVTSCLSARYPFLFIDEFQDTVPAQTNIVRLLAAQGSTVVVIGDAEQSIFTFAGAQPEHFRTFALPDTDQYTIADNRRSTDRIVALLNHVRSDGLTQRGIRAEEGEPVKMLVGSTPAAAQYVKAALPPEETLLIVARTGVVVQKAQLPAAGTLSNPWDDIDAADSDRRIFLHQLLAGVVLARQHRYDTAVRTILRGIRHTDGRLKAPLKCATRTTALQRRAIAITLLEALIQLGPALDTMTLRAAYDHCHDTLNNTFQSLNLSRITQGRIREAVERYTCDRMLCAVKLTNNEEVREVRTIHQAKATEHKTVLVCLEGRNDGDTQIRINHILNPTTPSDEEQRITYVAISRARDRLFLAVPKLTPAQEQLARALGIIIARLDT